MRRLRLLLPLLALLIVGCGGSSHTTSVHVPTTTVPVPTPAPFVCHHKVPAQMGECIRQELEHEGAARPKALGLTPLTLAGRAQCIDISRWQPHPDFRLLYREGIRCVIDQGADNTFASNPYFGEQVRAAHAAGMKIGVYVFAEGGFPVYQANVLIAVARPYRSLISLGAWVDAEVSSAYPQACGVVSALARSFHVFGVYGSPGTYRGGRCIGFVWPAEWGSGRAYPLPGYPFSAIKLRQWCGTCVLAGNPGQVDRNEDLGLIALSQPPETPAQHASRVHRARENRLQGDYHERRALNGELARLNCLHGYDHYRRQHRDRCTSLRRRHGVYSRDISRLHRLGV